MCALCVSSSSTVTAANVKTQIRYVIEYACVSSSKQICLVWLRYEDIFNFTKNVHVINYPPMKMY